MNNIIISDSITGIRCIDLYGIDIPHLWLHATTNLSMAIYLGKPHLSMTIYLRKHNLSMTIYLGKTRLKYGDLLKGTHSKYGYILKDFNTQSFSSWFLIGKNYIFHLENMGFSTKQYTYELTNIIVDVFKIHVISGNQ